MFDKVRKFNKEFKPRRPTESSFASAVDENMLRGRRLEGRYGDLAKAIEIAKQNPGIKQMLGVQDNEVGIFENGSERFLKTGEFFRHEQAINPTAKIADFKEMKIMSVNVGRFGEGSPSSKTEFMNFITTTFLREGHVLCLQDFRYDRDKDILQALKALGLDYYLNTFGQSKPKDSAGTLEIANLTIINPNKFAGYSLSMPTISITPNYQRVKVVKKDERGKVTSIKYKNSEARWDLNYAGKEDYLDEDHYAFQALNTEFVLQGVDGEIPINIGNIYNAPSSQMVDRIKSVLSSMKNLNTNNGFQILTGDFNTYGVDTARRYNLSDGHKNLPAHPFATVPRSATDTVLRLFPEKKFLETRLRRYTEHHLAGVGLFGKRMTIKAGPGKILGLQVDGCIARRDLKVGSWTKTVLFTDHKVLVSTVSRA